MSYMFIDSDEERELEAARQRHIAPMEALLAFPDASRAHLYAATIPDQLDNDNERRNKPERPSTTLPEFQLEDPSEDHVTSSQQEPSLHSTQAIVADTEARPQVPQTAPASTPGESSHSQQGPPQLVSQQPNVTPAQSSTATAGQHSAPPPPGVLRLARLIDNLPKNNQLANGVWAPTRRALIDSRRYPPLRREIAANTGELSAACTLRPYVGNTDLFSQEMWDYLMGES